MISRVFLLFLCGVISAHLGYAQKLPKVKKLNMRVLFNITSDTLTMKFHRPNQTIRLEGFILGYGSNYFTNQYVQWPDNGKSFITDVEAETRYLIAVKPNENHKTCKEKNSSQKPLQIVIGTLTPTSVFLSWGILINPQIDWSALSKCPNDRFYTVRYREKNKDWNFQLCPTTETVIDNLKPNTLYEFGVKDNSDEIWGKSQNHKTNPKGKENGNIENTYKIPKGTLQYATEDTKALIPVIVVKQGFQNITKSTAAPPPTVQGPVFREETKKPPLTNTRPPTPKPKPVSKVTESLPIPKASEKAIAEDPKPASPTNVPVTFTKELPVAKPETVLASDQLATYVPQPMTISQIIPAGEEPLSIEDPQLQSFTVGRDLLPEQQRTITNKDVPESVDVTHVSTDKPIKRHTTSASPPNAPVSFTKELPVVQPETVLASDHLATYMPQPMTVSQIIPGEEPLSSETPQLQSFTVSRDLLPEQQRTIENKGDVPESVDILQVSTDKAKKLRTTSGMRPISTVVPKLSTPLSFHKHTTTIATSSQYIPVTQSTMSSKIHKKKTSDSKLPESEIITTDAPHMYESEKTTLASNDHSIVQKHKSTSKSRTTIAYRTTTTPYATSTPTTSQRTQSSQASKRERVSPTQAKILLPKKTQPTTVPANTQTIPLIKDHSTVGPAPQIVPGKTEKEVSSQSNKTYESPSTTAVRKPAQTTKMPINLIRVHIFADPEPSVQSETQTTVPQTPNTSQSYKIPQTKLAPKTSKKVPIHLISLQIFDEPDVPMVFNSTMTPSESTATQRPERPHRTPVPVQKGSHPITQKPTSRTRTKPVPNTTLTPSQSTTTQRPESPSTTSVPVQKVSQPITKKPKPTSRTRTKSVPNITLTPFQSSTTQKPEIPNTTPVPVQKVSQPITQKPKPTPRTRTKPAPTAAPKETTTLPKIPHVTAAATLATYRVQHSSSRPRTSLRPRTRPAQNGTTQGSARPRPTGDFGWAPGTIPGGRILDSTKLLGVSRNISMEPNNTRKRTFSVSSPPLPPVKPTTIRRRIQYSNVTGRPGVTVSSPPLSPVKPTTIHRRQHANGTAKPAPAVDPTFSPSPKSDIDILGKPRFTGPHVKYINKEDNVPCSITESLKHFPSEENSNQDITNPPQNPPSNLTVVTVEGCSSFVILDWEMPNNDSATEFKVISTENGAPGGKNQSIITTNLTYSTVENLKPDTKYDFKVVPSNPLGEGPVSATVEFSTESADPRVSEPYTGGKDAIWTEIKFKSDSYSECKGKQYVKRTWYKKFVGIQLCNSLRYKIYLSNTLTGTFYNIGDQSGFGEDHCQFVDSFLDGRTGQQLLPEQLTTRKGFYRSVRQQPVEFGDMGGRTHISYVHWYECGIAIPGKW